jgi:hypothetical protein
MGDETFVLATGNVVALPTYRGQVVVHNQEVETLFIPGNSLLGLEFLSLIGTVLSFHLKHQTVRLAK